MAPASRTALVSYGHRCTPPPPRPLTATAISPVPAACEIQPARLCRALVPAAPPLSPSLTFHAFPFIQAAWRVPRVEPPAAQLLPAPLSYGIRYGMPHGPCVAPLYRILPSPPTFRTTITYMPALGLPIRLRLRLISSARSHSFPTAHLVAYPFQGSFRPRMDQMDSSRRTRSATGCSSSVTTSTRDSVAGSGRGLHLAAYARSAGKAVNPCATRV